MSIHDQNKLFTAAREIRPQPEIEKNHFDWSAAATELLACTSPEARQTLLDKIFTPELRAQKIASAELDQAGRPVRFYRYMSSKILAQLLANGEQRAKDIDLIHDSTSTQEQSPLIEDQSLLYILHRLVQKKYKNTDLKYSFKTPNEIIHDLFSPNDADKLLTLIQANDQDGIRQFLVTHTPEEFRQQIHTGSMGQKFSDYISLSVGGPINDSLYHHKDMAYVYVEMIIPSDRLTYTHSTFPGEKEVFVNELKRDDIAFVAASNTAFRQEILHHPNTPWQNDSTEEWQRWRAAPTEEYLPANFIQYLHSNYLPDTASHKAPDTHTYNPETKVEQALLVIEHLSEQYGQILVARLHSLGASYKDIIQIIYQARSDYGYKIRRELLDLLQPSIENHRSSFSTISTVTPEQLRPILDDVIDRFRLAVNKSITKEDLIGASYYQHEREDRQRQLHNYVLDVMRDKPTRINSANLIASIILEQIS